MRQVGLHIRITDSLMVAAEKALKCGVPFFQCFFTLQETGALMNISDEEIAFFVNNYRKKFSALYLHGSYWINLAGIKYDGYRAFQREIELAKKLSFTHMILHPGCAKGARHKQEGIDAFARALNKILKNEHDIKLVIENTAHGKMNVGSDIHDFKLLISQLDYPEKVSFALDTAHAFVYGYDISTERGQDEFVQLVDECIGLERVSLLHLNDSSKECGSCIDKHSAPGQGLIGERMLQRFANYSKLALVPVLLELPVMPEEQEYAVLQRVRNWAHE